ncbi:TlpA family protein disulfide reductase [Thauera sp.]
MKRKIQAALFATVAIAAAAGGFLLNREQSQIAPAGMHTVSQDTVDALLALRLPDTNGEEQAMAQWQGKVVVANFWATWCPPCRKEIPDFAAASQALADEPVQFVGISIDSAAKVRAFNEEFRVPYPLLIAGNHVLDLAEGFGNAARGLPFTVILDTEGKVRHIKLGVLRREELERKIRALLPS